MYLKKILISFSYSLSIFLSIESMEQTSFKRLPGFLFYQQHAEIQPTSTTFDRESLQLNVEIFRRKINKGESVTYYKELIDYAYALAVVQATLMQKHFSTWTTEDIEKVNALLSNTIDSIDDGQLAQRGMLRTRPVIYTKFNADHEFNEYEKMVFLGIQEKTRTVQSNAQFKAALTPTEMEIWETYYGVYLYEKDDIPGAMQDFINELHKRASTSTAIELAAFAHEQLTRIHPFDNGNGRTARILSFIILLQMGEWPFIMWNECPTSYERIAGASHYDIKILELYMQKMIETTKLYLKQLIDLDGVSLDIPVKLTDADHIQQLFNSFSIRDPKKAKKCIKDLKECGARKLTIKDKACNVCNKEGQLMVCAGCKVMNYCSKECQKKQWTTTHKARCKQLGEAFIKNTQSSIT